MPVVNAEDRTLISDVLGTTNKQSADQVNYGARGIKVVVDITAFAGTSITVTIEGKDPVSGKYFTLLASAALVATGTTILTVYPGLTAAANVTASDVLPRNWRVKTTGTYNNTTYTITGSTIL